ncbi:sugar isomerase SgaE [Spiroplasma clarkii]|uniref:L-ribulose-5-phosphate 4-epimerase n=1 Tax=Spiroplasma clarkii TaxID=2139 RepID=A0A1Y0L1N9_9MOLU|nr:L-ribulose-5-phosphate 4-epimerase AraD [Spiroplasma clarkii]ARU91893.1 sugar isomerase SgaE [Spiroplasma clarkii]ATX71240.1 L-ribulose-5-phosphate 4-epimerase [Spiroplasma clarkii]
MLEKLKQEVYEANMLLEKLNLVTFTWGNVSGMDWESGLMVIKPSGVSYEKLTPADMVVMDLNYQVVEGKLKPSTDAPTHIYLYNKYRFLQGICHTHSIYATSWCQAGVDLPAQGTTHADNFYGPVPCTKHLDMQKIKDNYEYETGVLIAATFAERNLDPQAMPAILVNNHGPFTFGESPYKAVEYAKVLETVGQMTFQSYLLNGYKNNVKQELLDKHYFRKHGKDSYYGQ